MSAYKEYLLSVWESRFGRLGEQYSLNDRHLLLARFGMIIAATLMILTGIFELFFFCQFLWDLFR
jgi:hypothetical protein